MIRSMTAFARISVEKADAELTWELRSVNHRYLEAFVRLPDELRSMEPLVRERINARLGRGKLECVLRCRWVAQVETALELDQDRLKAVLDACRRVEKRSAEATSPGVIDLLRWPGVVQQSEIDVEPLFDEASALLDKALAAIGEMRANEGARIEEMLASRCADIAAIATQVRERMPEVLAASRARQQERIDALDVEADPARLEVELALVATKLDVDEELDRLESHLVEMNDAIAAGKPVGRRLDFLMQELNREANTLGSKSADAETTKAAVDLKVLIEQMREQIQNVE